MSERDQQEAYFDYIEAQARFDATRRFEDAREAGKAWARFLYLFEYSPPQRTPQPVPGTNIIKFPDARRDAR